MTEWHSYTHAGQNRTLSALLLLSILLAWAWGWLQQACAIDVPWWLDTPAVLGFFAALNSWYESWGWRVFRFAHGIPDYSGEYTAYIHTSHNDHASIVPATVKIKQSWSHIVIRLNTGNSTSVSKGGYLVAVPGDGFRLVYLYHNAPRGHAAATMNQHDGTAELLFSEDGATAKGFYYNGRGRLTHGELTLSRASD